MVFFLFFLSFLFRPFRDALHTRTHTHTHTLHYATEYYIYICIEYYSHSLYRARPRQTDDCRNRLEEELLDTYSNTSLCV